MDVTTREAAMRVKVTMTWSNGDQIVTHEEWDPSYEESLGTWGPDDGAVCGFMESYAQSDFHPLRDMDEWSDGELITVTVERVE